MSEMFGVRTVWHGPGGTSPVGHAANLMLELNTWNFGVHEWAVFPERTLEVFPGCPEVRDGHMWPNGKPGLGIDMDEKLAAKYPDTGARHVQGTGPPGRRRDRQAIRNYLKKCFDKLSTNGTFARRTGLLQDERDCYKNVRPELVQHRSPPHQARGRL